MTARTHLSRVGAYKTAQSVLHDNGVPAWQYAEYLAARHSAELRRNGEEPF